MNAGYDYERTDSVGWEARVSSKAEATLAEITGVVIRLLLVKESNSK